MADTTFVDYSTVVPAAWLNDVNDLTYSGQFPLTTRSAAIGNTPLVPASEGNTFYIYNSFNTGTVESNSTLRIQSLNRNANVQIIANASFEAGVQFLNPAFSFVGGMTYQYSTGDIYWRTSPAGVATEMLRLTQAGNLLMKGATSALGYGTGSGGTVTQLTNKATAVTLNKGSGQIIMNASSLAAGVSVSFQCNNSLVEQTDCIICNRGNSTGATETYRLLVDRVGGGAIIFTLTNLTGGALAEAVVINFAIIKGVTS